MKGKLGLTLFGLPFLAVGLWMLWSIGTTLTAAAAMSAWQPVPATLTDAGYRRHSGEDADTYEAYASYRYTVAGRDYRGERVAISGGADNIGDFQRDLGNRLAAAQAAGRPVTAYVNPDDPADAVIDRSVRWGLLAFKGLFLLVFGGIGGGLVVFAWRRRTGEPVAPEVAGASPWLANTDWQGAPLKSGSRAAMWAAWLFAALWNAISAPLPFVAWEEIAGKGNWLALLALLFPLVGIGLLAWAVRRTREWRRFGPAPLALDPFPGSIGGHVGGSIDLGLPFDPGAQFEVTLTAVSSYMSGSGKDRSRRERAEWQDTRLAVAEPGGSGTRLLFRFEVPAGLAESDALKAGDDYSLWRLNLAARLPGSDLDRHYEIPVYATAERSRRLSERTLARGNVATEAYAEARIRERFRFDRDAGGPRLTFPVGRYLGPGLAGTLIGAGFAAAGWFIAVREGSLLFGSIFGGVGALVATGCLYAMLNSLTVRQEGGDLVSVRRLLGLPLWRRRVAKSAIAALRKSSSTQTHSGGRHVMHYSLRAVDGAGGEIAVGEGFRGESEADAAARFIAREFGLRLDAIAPAAVDDNPLAADR